MTEQLANSLGLLAWAAHTQRERKAAMSPWVPADAELPGNPRCVLATDMEAHFVAIYEDEKWINAHTSEEIDSVVTHWMELPEVPVE